MIAQFSLPILLKVANHFEKTLEVEAPPVSMERAPISIERHKDLLGSLKEDVKKSTLFASPILLEDIQKYLARNIAKSMEKHGFQVSEMDIKKALLNFGSHSKAEEEFLANCNKITSNYSDKAIHYILNNLAW